MPEMLMLGVRFNMPDESLASLLHKCNEASHQYQLLRVIQSHIQITLHQKLPLKRLHRTCDGNFYDDGERRQGKVSSFLCLQSLQMFF